MPPSVVKSKSQTEFTPAVALAALEVFAAGDVVPEGELTEAGVVKACEIAGLDVLCVEATELTMGVGVTETL